MVVASQNRRVRGGARRRSGRRRRRIGLLSEAEIALGVVFVTWCFCCQCYCWSLTFIHPSSSFEYLFALVQILEAILLHVLLLRLSVQIALAEFAHENGRVEQIVYVLLAALIDFVVVVVFVVEKATGDGRRFGCFACFLAQTATATLGPIQTRLLENDHADHARYEDKRQEEAKDDERHAPENLFAVHALEQTWIGLEQKYDLLFVVVIVDVIIDRFFGITQRATFDLDETKRLLDILHHLF